MRKRIYEILEVGEDDDIASRAYDLDLPCGYTAGA